MDHSREAAVRARAYQLWVESDYADGYQDQHWRQAEREILEQSAGRHDDPAPDQQPAPQRPQVHSDGMSIYPSVIDPAPKHAGIQEAAHTRSARRGSDGDGGASVVAAPTREKCRSTRSGLGRVSGRSTIGGQCLDGPRPRPLTPARAPRRRFPAAPQLERPIRCPGPSWRDHDRRFVLPAANPRMACGGWPKTRMKARRMRSSSPKPVSRATTSTGCRLCSIISRAASRRRVSIALAGVVPVSARNARLNWRGLRPAAAARSSTEVTERRFRRTDAKAFWMRSDLGFIQHRRMLGLSARPHEIDDEDPGDREREIGPEILLQHMEGQVDSSAVACRRPDRPIDDEDAVGFEPDLGEARRQCVVKSQWVVTRRWLMRPASASAKMPVQIEAIRRDDLAAWVMKARSLGDVGTTSVFPPTITVSNLTSPKSLVSRRFDEPRERSCRPPTGCGCRRAFSPCWCWQTRRRTTRPAHDGEARCHDEADGQHAQTSMTRIEGNTTFHRCGNASIFAHTALAKAPQHWA